MTTESMKPYPAYKDSGIEWIGKIPEGWGTIQIKRLSQIKRGASPRPIEDQKYFDDDGDFAWVRIADVSASDKYLENTTQTLSELGASLSVKRYPGDMFLSIAGTVGKPIITKIKCCIHDGFVWFPNLKIKPKFLYYIFLAGEAYKGLGKMGTQLNLNTETVGSIPIPLPPSEQDISKIIDFLEKQTSKIDTLVENKQKQIELLKEERTAIINQAVTKGLNPDVPMKDSGIEWLGEMPEHWDLVPLKYLLLDGKNGIKIGPFGSSLKSDIITSKGYKVYGQENIINDDFSIGHRFVDDIIFDKLNAYEIFENDILITMMGTTGKSKVVPANIKKGIMDSHLIRIRNNNNSNSHFVSLLINDSNYIYSQLKKNSKGSIMEGLNSSIVKSLLIACPPLNEQKNILYYIQKQKNKLNCEIQISENQIILLQEYRTALISEAVTGKIDLRNEHETPASK